MRRCLHCGSSATVGEGSVLRGLPFLLDGRPSRRTVTAARVGCKDCGRKGTAYDASDLLDRAELRNHLADRTFALGQAAAATEAGIPATTLQRHLAAWSIPREPGPADASPDAILVLVTRIRNLDAVLVVDADRETAVELLWGYEAFPAWLARPGRDRAFSIAIPPDPRLAAAARAHLPDARLAILPAGLAASLVAMARLGLAGLRRMPGMAMRNGFPTEAEFMEALDGRTQPHGGWPFEAASLLAATRLALAICGSGSSDRLEALWPEMALLAGERGAGPVGRVMATWREGLRNGLDDPAVGALHPLAEEACRRLAVRRPALGPADLRAYAILRTYDGAHGVPLRDLVDGMAA